MVSQSLLRSHGVLAGRILMGLLFVFSGIGLVLGDITETAEFYTAMGVPLAGVTVYLVIFLKIGAGGALMLGWRTATAALVLIGFTLLATLIAHMDTGDVNLWKNLAIVGGLLYAMAYGNGDGWSVEGSGESVTVGK